MILYNTLDNGEMSLLTFLINTCSLVLFLAASMYGLNNIVRFWKLRTYQMGIFYAMAMSSLLTRSCFFVIRYLYDDTYTNLIFIILPGIFSLSVVLAQIMIYSILCIELTIYMQKICDKPMVVSAEMKKYNCWITSVKVLFTIAIIALFTFFGVQFL